MENASTWDAMNENSQEVTAWNRSDNQKLFFKGKKKDHRYLPTFTHKST